MYKSQKWQLYHACGLINADLIALMAEQWSNQSTDKAGLQCFSTRQPKYSRHTMVAGFGLVAGSSLKPREFNINSQSDTGY